MSPPVSHNHIRHFILLSGNLHWRCQFCKLHVLSCRSCFAAEQCQVPRTVPTISFLCHCLLLLIMTPHNLTADTVGSVLIVFFFVSSGRFSFQYLPAAIRKTIEYIGQNTLPVFLFSPIFTFMCKVFVPFFRFDSSGILFLVISLVLCVSGSLIIGMIIDTTGMSSYLIGRTFVIRKTAPL